MTTSELDTFIATGETSLTLTEWRGLLVRAAEASPHERVQTYLGELLHYQIGGIALALGANPEAEKAVKNVISKGVMRE